MNMKSQQSSEQITPNQVVLDLARHAECAVADLSPQLKEYGGRTANFSMQALNQIAIILHDLAWQLGREAFISGASNDPPSDAPSSCKADLQGLDALPIDCEVGGNPNRS